LTVRIIHTNDGSKTLFNEELAESYHSGFGALQESLHVFIQHGLAKVRKDHIKIFEVGFGTGLNACLSLFYAIDHHLQIDYHAVDNFIPELNYLQQLQYHLLRPEHSEMTALIQNAEWNKKIKIGNHFQIMKILSDFRDYKFSSKYDLIIFDAFSPQKQPDMWTEAIFKKCFDALNNEGILSTYSSMGKVKENLRKVGFNVHRLPGPEGKRHILNAIKMLV